MTPAQSDTASPDIAKKKRFGFGRLIDDFLVLASGQLFSKVFGFLAFAWMARQLTVEDYGAVETAVGMAAIGAIALEMGTGAIGVRRISQSDSAAMQVLGDVIAGRMLLAVVAAPLLALFYIAATRSSAPDLLFWVFTASLFAIPFNHNWFFQAHERMGVAGFGQTLKMGVFFAAVLLLAPQKNGVVFVAVSEVIAAFSMALWFCAFSYMMIRPQHPQYSIEGGVTVLRESAQLGASTFVNALAQYMPVLLVASAANDVETANFGAAQRLILSLMTFSYVYYFNLFPLIARRMIDDTAALGRIVTASVRVTAWVGVAAGVLLWTFAPIIMRLVFGATFEPAGRIFGILVWSGVIILVSGNARWLLVAGKRQGSLLVAHIVNASCVVGLGYILSSLFGGAGAAAACIVGAGGLWLVAHHRTKGLDVRPDLSGNLIPAATAVAVVTSLTLLNLQPLPAAGIAVAMLATGVFADRRLPGAINALIEAKSAT
ncbi:MAG: oligosaccharide flippase family protein [Pseudomonadota bacterium]